MHLTPQHRRILDMHRSGDWVCSTSIEFIRDQRKRISELNQNGFTFEAQKCNLHSNHNANLLMRRLVDVPSQIKQANDRLELSRMMQEQLSVFD